MEKRTHGERDNLRPFFTKYAHMAFGSRGPIIIMKLAGWLTGWLAAGWLPVFTLFLVKVSYTILKLSKNKTKNSKLLPSRTSEDSLYCSRAEIGGPKRVSWLATAAAAAETTPGLLCTA